MKGAILSIIAFICISNFALAQQDSLKTQTDSLKTKRSNSFVQFKIGAGSYFIRSNPITLLYQTNAFFMPTMGLEIVGKHLGTYLDVASTLTTNINVDSLNVLANTFNFRQTHINAGFLSRAKLHQNIFFRGKLGLSYLYTRETFFDISFNGWAANIGAGVEFKIAPVGIYFVEVNYIHQRNREVGRLGGTTVTMGFKFGRVE